MFYTFQNNYIFHSEVRRHHLLYDDPLKKMWLHDSILLANSYFETPKLLIVAFSPANRIVSNVIMP